MPTINDLDIDFDSMSDEELETYLLELREAAKTRKPRAGAVNLKPKEPKEPKASKPKKSERFIIRVALDDEKKEI